MRAGGETDRQACFLTDTTLPLCDQFMHFVKERIECIVDYLVRVFMYCERRFPCHAWFTSFSNHTHKWLVGV